jgi:hypothetical protein
MQHIRHFLLMGILLISLSTYAQWESVGTGLTGSNLRIYSLSVVDANTIWGVAAGAGANTSRMFTRTIDGGTMFSTGEINTGATDYTNVAIFAQSASVAYVIQNKRAEGDEARMFRPSDGGNNWEELTGPFNADGKNLKAVHFFDANNGVAFGSAGNNENSTTNLSVYTTGDAGNTWAEVAAGSLPTSLPSEGTWTDAGNNGYEAIGNTIWFGTTSKRVWKSTDRGLTWTAAILQFTNINGGVNSVAFKDANNGVAISQYGEYATTTDGGQTWSNYSTFSSLSPTPSVVEYIPNSGGTYLIADGIYALADMRISTDNGNTWTTFIPKDENGTNTTISSVGLVFLSNSQGFASTSITNATQGGILSWNEALSTSIGPFGSLEAVAGLRAFPNPTADRLSLSWTASQVEAVHVLDAQGRVLQRQTTGLAQELTLSLADYPAGMYLVRVLAHDQQSTLRIVRQ